MKRQAGRPSKENGVPVGHNSIVGKSREILASESQDSNTQIQRYVRLTNLVHQVLQIAVDDDFIRNNPSDNVLRELKKAHCFQSEKRRALTKPEQELFLNFLKTHPVYEH